MLRTTTRFRTVLASWAGRSQRRAPTCTRTAYQNRTFFNMFGWTGACTSKYPALPGFPGRRATTTQPHPAERKTMPGDIIIKFNGTGARPTGGNAAMPRSTWAEARSSSPANRVAVDYVSPSTSAGEAGLPEQRVVLPLAWPCSGPHGWPSWCPNQKDIPAYTERVIPGRLAWTGRRRQPLSWVPLDPGWATSTKTGQAPLAPTFSTAPRRPRRCSRSRRLMAAARSVCSPQTPTWCGTPPCRSRHHGASAGSTRRYLTGLRCHQGRRRAAPPPSAGGGGPNQSVIR